MADKKPGAASPRAVPSLSVPPPPASLAKLVKTVPWPQGQVIHRIHLNLYGGNEFNPGIKGNARFSPIQTPEGASIPTLYGGMTFDCAAMETVFHDVPFVPGLKTFDKQKLVDQVYSTVTPQRSLALADLSATALRRLGIRRSELIDTEKDQYPRTRRWAEAIHTACPTVEGLCWVSRQDDRGLAIVLFGDRVGPHDLVAAGGPRSVLGGIEVYSDLLALAERIGVNVVGGR
jgi:hypothetical protein